jgi:hypothetical protein
MTRPRSTYEYGAQTVCEGPWRFEARGTSLELSRSGERLWRHTTTHSTQQAFVSNDGRTATLDAADILTFRTPDGRVLSEGSLLDVACPGWREDREGRSPVRHSTAGPTWERFLAACFLPASVSADFIVCGRGVEPFILSPSSMMRTTMAPTLVRDVLRTRAPEVLRCALDALLTHAPAYQAHGEPWRFAAVGWARVAGECGAQDATSALTALATRPLCADAYTTLLCGPRPTDAINVRMFALDPLRQATRLALLRMGHRPPPVAVMLLAERSGLFSVTWRAIDPPTDQDRAWHDVAAGISPSALVTRVGGPSFVERRDDRLWWCYDVAGSAGPRTIALSWGRSGAEELLEEPSIPLASIDGRVA